MTPDELEQAIAELRRSCDELQHELAAQKELNQQQSEQINRAIARGGAQFDLAAMCGLTFVGMLGVGLLSLRIQGDAIEFDPLGTIEKLLGVPTVAAVVAAIAAALLKKYLPEKASS